MNDQSPMLSRRFRTKWPAVLILTALLFTGAFFFNRRLLNNTFRCLEGSTADQAECGRLDEQARQNQRIQQVMLPTSIIVYRLAAKGPVSSMTQQVFLYSNILFYFLVSEILVSAVSTVIRRRGRVTT